MIKDYTKDFIRMMLHSAEYGDFAPSIGILADRGWGKTCLEFIIYTLLLSGDSKRNVKIYKAPLKLLEEIKLAFPPVFADRFGIIDDVFDIEENDILGIDEAGLVLDGKKALTKEQREFIAGLTYARHNHVPVIWCTVHSGISKHMKILSEIKIYKHMNYDFMSALVKDGDYFVKEKAHILTRIPIEKALFRANYRYFSDSKGNQIYEGGLILPKDKYCKWFSDGISQNMFGSSMASERSKDMDAKTNLDSVVQEVIDFYGNELKKGNRNALIHGYLQKVKPLEYQKYRDYISDIGYQALYQLFVNKQDNTPEIKVKLDIPKISVDIDGSGFIPFMEKMYIENLPQRVIFNHKTTFEREKLLEVLKSWASGLGIRQITIPIGKGKTIAQLVINDIIKLFKDGKRKSASIPNNLRLYNIYEIWIQKRTHASVRDGSIGEPDLYFEIDGQKYPAECKLWDDIAKCLAMDKRVKLKPSLDYCSKYDISHFPLFFRNVKWGDVDYMFDIPVKDEYIINLEGLKANILHKFDPKTFWSE